jgi:chromosome segregation ATPase
MPNQGRRAGGSRWITILPICVVLAGGAIVFWQARLILTQKMQLTSATRENEDLRRRIAQQTSSQPGPPPSPSAVPAPRTRQPNATAAEPSSSSAEQEVPRLRESLAQSTAETARLEAHIAELQSQIETATTENRRLSAAGEELKRNLAEANQTIDNVRAELKTGADRITQLENAAAKISQDAAAGKQSAAQVKQTVSDLEGIFRRREMYLNNVLRRYKEVTEQYRALSGVLDGRRDRDAVPVSGTEISRIQNTIAQAEEDLKQINALNVQASRLEKKLPGN